MNANSFAIHAKTQNCLWKEKTPFNAICLTNKEA